MRDTLQVFTGIILLGLLLFSACSDYDRFEPYEHFDDRFVYLNDLQPEGTVARIDPSTAHTIITSDSVLMEIPASAFVDQYGQIYRGEVQLMFSFLESKQHLMAYGISLVERGGQLIEPMVVIRMNAFTLSGDVLTINPLKSMRIKYPKALQFELPQVFLKGNDGSDTSMGIWERVHSSDYNNKVYKESWTWKSEEGDIRHSSGLILHTDISDWIVLGYPVENPLSMQLNAYLPGQFDPANFRVYLFGHEYNNVQELSFNEERHAFCNKSGIIVQEDVLTVVVLSQSIDQEIYLEIKNLQVDSDLETLLNPSLTDVGEALNMLENL